jgi:radical SAM enzyme (TIGR01210 family)
MDDLSRTIGSLRRKESKQKSPREYVTYWVEKDVLDGDVVNAFVMILRTQGCHWALSSGCSMCGYINDATKSRVSDDDLWYQYKRVMQNYSGEKIVKVFTSGSFLDEDEIPSGTQDKILKDLSERTDKIIIESRPEFIDSKRLMGKENLEVAIGLESANNIILKHSINKGFEFENYMKAVNILAEQKIGVKTYLLVKPPFLSERDAIFDCISSAKKIANQSQTISYNPVNIQSSTLVERLWRRGEYRSPWLWSVVEVLANTSTLENLRVMSSPTGGGTKRGAHNCGICDREVLKAIDNFSLSQDPSHLEGLDCQCKKLWKDVLRTENISRSQGDLTRLI